MPESFYFVAGEASGDAHGAALMQALRQRQPDALFHGRGGPRMRALAAGTFTDWSESSSVLGLWEVVKQYGYFRRQFRATIEQIRELNPHAVVLIDYPGFNLRLARALRAQLPDLKIIYYISPQVWAWNQRRIPQMARYLDLMLCIFPFEAELYNRSKLCTVFVGHPMLESLEAKRISDARDPDLIGLFPGSRMREITKILPKMLGAAKAILSRRSAARFEIVAASEKLAREIEGMLRASNLSPNAAHVTVGTAASTMQRAQVGVVASGTATLEAAFFRLPFVLVYRVAWPTYLAARMVVKVKHLGMPNVLAGKEVVQELIQHHATPHAIEGAVMNLLEQPRARDEMVREFDRVVAQLGDFGASGRAAAAIFELLYAPSAVA